MPAQIVAIFVSTKNRAPLIAKREASALENRGIEMKVRDSLTGADRLGERGADEDRRLLVRKLDRERELLR